ALKLNLEKYESRFGKLAEAAEPSSQAMDGQRIPRSCLTTEATSTPDLKARE
ncbi:unnamed protein product, partial [marine sediment metagenome]